MEFWKPLVVFFIFYFSIFLSPISYFTKAAMQRSSEAGGRRIGDFDFRSINELIVSDTSARQTLVLVDFYSFS